MRIQSKSGALKRALQGTGACLREM